MAMNEDERRARAEARHQAERESWQPFIAAAVAAAPPLSEDQKVHLRRLLRPVVAP
jgi:hypothetical protein